MSIFRLPDDNIFPSPELAESSGLLAVGGDLNEDRLLLAYSMGIFPWYSQGDPILWWSPDPRLVLFPHELRISRSLKQSINKNVYKVTLDNAFEEVIMNCASVNRKKAGDTWLTEEMIDAYIRLHHAGYAHSVEAWSGGKLAGGLYGVALGSAFFGESMFMKKSNASKVAFITVAQQLFAWDFSLIDCQIPTAHLKTFGASEIPRTKFLVQLKDALQAPDRKGPWKFDEGQNQEVKD